MLFLGQYNVMYVNVPSREASCDDFDTVMLIRLLHGAVVAWQFTPPKYVDFSFFGAISKLNMARKSTSKLFFVSKVSKIYVK